MIFQVRTFHFGVLSITQFSLLIYQNINQFYRYIQKWSNSLIHKALWLYSPIDKAIPPQKSRFWYFYTARKGLSHKDFLLYPPFDKAVPTAEGGIEIALAELPITLHGSDCLVLGYGRIGKVLCKMLSGIGAHVTAMARSHDALAWIDAYGFRGMHIDTLPQRAGEFDLIFNTIPHKLITAEVLGAVKKDALIIDLASRPGGVDMAAAQELGVKAIWALSLPGKVAPITAGNIIMQAVLNICEGLGI